MAYFTKPDYSRQLKQYSGTSAVFSGQTNILEKFSIKNIEVDTKDAQLGNVLIYDGAKFRAANIGSFGSSIIQGLNLTYNSGLTYDISSGSFVIDSILYQGYTGGSVTVQSGQTGGSRFDVVYITSGQTALVRSGQTATNPSVPTLSGGELQIGIILIPINFTGGTGSTVIQTTSTTVFEFYNTGTGIQRLPNTTNASAPGDFSFAPMREAIAYGQDSVALGYNSRASGYSQTVVGPYNDPNTNDYFQVGNGTVSSRSNAFRVTTGGSAYIQNKLFVSNGIEIEVTGASNGQVLKYDGTKFKPQLETITGLTFFTGGSSFISSITSNSLLVKALTGSTGVTITDSNGLITLGLQLSGTNAVTLIQSLTGGTSIVSAKTGTTYFLYPIQGSGGTSVGLTDNKVTIYSDPISLINGANVGAGGAGVFYTKSVNELQFRRLSSATPTNLSINESGELLIFSVTGGSGTGLTSGTSLGDGVKILFSSDTTSLSFVTLSSQTPSTLRIVSSSTGVILFSATTGSQGISGTYVSGLTSAGTGNYSIISSITNNKLVYRTLSAGTGMQITESNGTLVFVSTVTGGTGSGITGNFVPLTGTTSGSPMQGNLVFSGTNGIIVDDGISRNSLTATGLTFSWPSTNNSLYIQANFLNSQSNQQLYILDTTTGNGFITTVPNIAGQANKFIKVKSDELGFDFFEGYTYIDLANAQTANTLNVGQWYRIPVSSRTVTEANNPNNYGDILLFAVETNKLSNDGYLFAINADYNYTNSYANLGVPYDGITVNNSDVIIWNNRHWENTSFSVVINNQNDITSQLSPLTKDYVSSNGYTIEVDKITYDITNDRILSRIDKRGNIIHENNANLVLDRFRFGDDNVTNNFIKASNIQNFDVLNIPKNNFIFKDNTFTCFNKLFFDTSTVLLPTGTSCPVYISGISVNDGKFEALNRVTAYNGSINNFKSTIEETLTLTSTSIDLRYKYLTGKITLSSGSSFNGVVSAITQIVNVLYNVDVTFNVQADNISGITFQNSELMKTEGGLNAFISGTTYDTIEFGQPYGQLVFLQKNINNYI